MTERDHLQAYARATGEVVPELEVPPVPRCCVGLWNAFIELHNARTNNGMGPNGLSFSDIAAWQQLHGVSFSPWELETVLKLDQIAIKSLNESTAKAVKPPGDK